jgi:Cd2+/Zn2+-exporting ATPase
MPQAVPVIHGRAFALDGVITAGSSTLDRAVGESLPADKTVGDAVFAGTVNLNNTLEYA